MSPSKETRKIYQILALLNPLGVAASVYLLYLHWKPEASSVCNISEKFDCDIVNKSKYSEILNIPVSLLGVLAYSFLFFFALRGFKKDQSKLMPFMMLFVSGALAFALYLTGIEAFVLKAFCIFCLSQQVIILIEWGLMARLYKLTKKS